MNFHMRTYNEYQANKHDEINCADEFLNVWQINTKQELQQKKEETNKHINLMKK